MNKLMPEHRVDANGKLVKRYVRKDVDAAKKHFPAPASAMPPALRRTRIQDIAATLSGASSHRESPEVRITAVERCTDFELHLVADALSVAEDAPAAHRSALIDCIDQLVFARDVGSIHHIIQHGETLGSRLDSEDLNERRAAMQASCNGHCP